MFFFSFLNIFFVLLALYLFIGYVFLTKIYKKHTRDPHFNIYLHMNKAENDRDKERNELLYTTNIDLAISKIWLLIFTYNLRYNKKFVPISYRR